MTSSETKVSSSTMTFEKFTVTYLQHGKRRLSWSRSLELGQPVPSLPWVSADLIEESSHVAVYQIPVGQRVPVWGGEEPQVLLVGQSRGLSSRVSRVRARHAALWAEHPPLSVAGIPSERRRWGTRQVLSCHHHGSTTGGTAVYFCHVVCRRSSL